MEHFESFEQHVPTDTERECYALLKDQEDLLMSMEFNDNRASGADDITKIANILKDIKVQMEMFGIYGGKIACTIGSILASKLSFECIDPKIIFAIK